MLRYVNSNMRIPSVSMLLSNGVMDVKSARRKNLEGLITEFGTIEDLARATNTVANYLSQVRGDSRKMGDKMARKLEAGLKKERGWVDTLRFRSADDVVDQTEVLQIWEGLSVNDREAWMKHGRLLGETNPKRSPANPFGPMKARGPKKKKRGGTQ